MPVGVLLREGRRLFLVDAAGDARPLGELGPDSRSAAESVAGGFPGALPDGILRALAGAAPACPEPALARALARQGVALVEIRLPELRAARERLPPPERARAREFDLEVARAAVARALASPAEELIALAREEERTERALGREGAAREQFLAGEVPALQEHLEAWGTFHAEFERHHRGLAERLERRARAVAPNLSSVLGATVAARLVAAAGSLEALGRMSASRLQLLGARRRPGAGRGPRYGILYRAIRPGEVALGREGAYARSLAAWAAIAARADAFTRADLSAEFARRRERRRRALLREAP